MKNSKTIIVVRPWVKFSLLFSSTIALYSAYRFTSTIGGTYGTPKVLQFDIQAISHQTGDKDQREQP